MFTMSLLTRLNWLLVIMFKFHYNYIDNRTFSQWPTPVYSFTAVECFILYQNTFDIIHSSTCLTNTIHSLSLQTCVFAVQSTCHGSYIVVYTVENVNGVGEIYHSSGDKSVGVRRAVKPMMADSLKARQFGIPTDDDVAVPVYYTRNRVNRRTPGIHVLVFKSTVSPASSIINRATKIYYQ